MEKINFEAGTQVSPAKVTIDNVDHEVTPAVWEGNTPLSPFVLNKMQDNIEKDINSTKEHKYHLNITTAVESMGQVTLPFYYKVGSDCLDVFYMGERLIKNTSDVEGHYNEVGDAGSISNKIQVGWKVNIGRYFDFVVRGDYSA